MGVSSLSKSCQSLICYCLSRIGRGVSNSCFLGVFKRFGSFCSLYLHFSFESWMCNSVVEHLPSSQGTLHLPARVRHRLTDLERNKRECHHSLQPSAQSSFQVSAVTLLHFVQYCFSPYHRRMRITWRPRNTS